jgi:hypothetical protein
MIQPPAHIEVRLQKLAQLFNSMDPSPFHERDLDADAEEFIVSWARELPKHTRVELLVKIKEVPRADRAANLEEAVRHYFRDRAALKQREYRQLLRQGRTSLCIGLVFLAACFGISELVDQLGYLTVASIIKESLTIGGWVAMWRPLETYLYDWWPLRDEWRLLERLSQMKVGLLVSPASPAAAGSDSITE